MHFEYHPKNNRSALSAGSPNPDCESYPNNVGLWVDALTFAVVTVQIIIFDTQYSEMMREYLQDWNMRAG